MNKERQRIAIAEACGWWFLWETDNLVWRGTNPDGTGDADLPDYPNDLNELAAARDQLIVTPELRIKWANTLRDVVGHTSPHRNKAGKPVVSDIDILFATAEQLSETLLRTLKLWADKA
jgi:hypothetical protein